MVERLNRTAGSRQLLEVLGNQLQTSPACLKLHYGIGALDSNFASDELGGGMANPVI